MSAIHALRSPCIGVCIVDPATDSCRGCYRTLAEISSWISFTPAERIAVLAALERRREGEPHVPPPLPESR